jgi:hypothetical protein
MCRGRGAGKIAAPQRRDRSTNSGLNDPGSAMHRVVPQRIRITV